MQINPMSATNVIRPADHSGVKSGKEGANSFPGPKSSQVRTDKERLNQHQQENQPIEELDVIQAIEHANKSLEGIYTHFEFSIHEDTREIMVKIIDRDSGEVIREIPPEHILDMVAKMWELAGILIDEHI